MTADEYKETYGSTIGRQTMIEWHRRSGNSYSMIISDRRFIISVNIDGEWDARVETKDNQYIVNIDGEWDARVETKDNQYIPIGFTYTSKHLAAEACLRSAGLGTWRSIFIGETMQQTNVTIKLNILMSSCHPFDLDLETLCEDVEEKLLNHDCATDKTNVEVVGSVINEDGTEFLRHETKEIDPSTGD